MSKNDAYNNSSERVKKKIKLTEIARMISGTSVTELTRENAREMIAQNHK